MEADWLCSGSLGKRACAAKRDEGRGAESRGFGLGKRKTAMGRQTDRAMRSLHGWADVVACLGTKYEMLSSN